MNWALLPLDVVYLILEFEGHFVMRRGELVSIISKYDVRYTILRSICRTYSCDFEYDWDSYEDGTWHRYEYDIPNTCDIPGRRDLHHMQDDHVIWIEGRPLWGEPFYEVSVFRCLEIDNETVFARPPWNTIPHTGSLTGYSWKSVSFFVPLWDESSMKDDSWV